MVSWKGTGIFTWLLTQRSIPWLTQCKCIVPLIPYIYCCLVCCCCFFIYLMCWNKLILRPEWSQVRICGFSIHYWTTMFSDKQFAFWMVQCGAGSWTWWSLQVSSNSGHPSILWLSSFNQNSTLRKLLLMQNYFKIQNFTFFLFS